MSREMIQPLVLLSTGTALEQARLGSARLRHGVVRWHGLPSGRMVMGKVGDGEPKDFGAREGEV